MINPDLFRRVQISVTGPTICVDLVYKKNPKLIHTPVFRFEVGQAVHVLGFDSVKRSWMDVWATWSGPRKKDLENPQLIPIDCKDSDGFTWTAPLGEFLNPLLFTTKDWKM